MLRALACWIGIHTPAPGTNPEMSIFWRCDRCAKAVAGGLAWRRR